MLKRIYVLGLSLFLITLGACQMQEDTVMRINKITPRHIAYNYILTHGMCMGYLRSVSSMSIGHFKVLVQKDQNARFYTLYALAHPQSHNLKLAQASIQELIDVMR